MPGRYEIVDEPEAMEIADDDVYHPDLTVRGGSAVGSASTGGLHSFRTLEPVVAGPIGLKTIFYNPRWSETQRKVCLGVLIFVSICCLAIFISLVVGLANVISYINQSERMRQSGLFIVPNIIDNEAGLFYYDLPEKGDIYRKFADDYVQQIETFLETYYNQSNTSTDCPEDQSIPGKGQVCRFDVDALGTNCTKQNKFGYYDGSPCLLFGLRKLGQWRPEMTQDYLNDLSKRMKISNYATHSIPLACSAVLTSFGGYQFSPGVGEEYFDYYPNAGFRIANLRYAPNFDQNSWLTPLVFVQLKNFRSSKALHVTCTLLAKNVESLDGLRTVNFEYRNASLDSEVMEDID